MFGFVSSLPEKLTHSSGGKRPRGQDILNCRVSFQVKKGTVGDISDLQAAACRLLPAGRPRGWGWSAHHLCRASQTPPAGLQREQESNRDTTPSVGQWRVLKYNQTPSLHAFSMVSALALYLEQLTRQKTHEAVTKPLLSSHDLSKLFSTPESWKRGAQKEAKLHEPSLNIMRFNLTSPFRVLLK